MDKEKALLLRPPHLPNPLAIPSFTATRGYDTSAKRLIAMWQYQFNTSHGVPAAVLREVYHRKRLTSPGVLAVHDVVMTEQAVYIVSEDLDGTLKDVIEARSSMLSRQFIRKLSKGLLCAVAFIHSKGVIHSGLSPECVHVGESGAVKISHFYAATSGKETQNAPFSRYASPESLKDGYIPTQAYDLWSVACILLESATLRPVFEANNLPALETLLETQIKPLNAVSALALLQRLVPSADPLFLDLIYRLMQWEPKDRVAAAEALKHPFLVE